MKTNILQWVICAGIGALVGAAYWYGQTFWQQAGQAVAAFTGVFVAAFLGLRVMPRKGGIRSFLGFAAGAVIGLLALFQAGQGADLIRAAGGGAFAGFWLGGLLKLAPPSPTVGAPAAPPAPGPGSISSWTSLGAVVGVAVTAAKIEVVSDVVRQFVAVTTCGFLAGAVLVNLQYLFPFVRKDAETAANKASRWFNSMMDKETDGNTPNFSESGCATLITRLTPHAVQLLLSSIGCHAGAYGAAFSAVVGLFLTALFGGGVMDGPGYWIIASALAWTITGDVTSIGAFTAAAQAANSPPAPAVSPPDEKPRLVVVSAQETEQTQ